MKQTTTQLGAYVAGDTVVFSVWAPFADAVAVMGSFNDWAATAMVNSDGIWSVKMPGAIAGQEYKYAITHGGQTVLKNDPRSRQLTPSGDNSVIADPEFDWQNDNFTLAPPNQLVIYELHIGTFSCPDQSTPGTFASATEKLDYLANLGVNVIELMPSASMWRGRGWGYAPTYLYAVESAYGGRFAFMEFVKAAHQRGIGVVLDMVYNHLGPDGLDLWQFDGWSQNGKGGIYFYNDWRSTTPWGDTRLDYGRSEVRQYIRENALMWLQDCHVDGLRLDSTHNIRNAKGVDDPATEIAEGWQVLQEVTTAVHQANSNAIVIAEDTGHNVAIARDVESGGAGFNAEWDTVFPFLLRDVLNPVNDADRNLDLIKSALEGLAAVPMKRVVYSESHDADANGRQRLSEEIDSDDPGGYYARKRSTLAAALCLTTPGIPMLFQGQEFMESGSFNDWQLLDWSKADTHHGIVELYRHLVALRRDLHGVSGGLTGDGFQILACDNQTKVLTYHRWSGEQQSSVVVAINFSHQASDSVSIPLPSAGLWRVRFNSDWQGYSADFGGTQTSDINAESTQAIINIGPYSAVIFSQDK